MSRLSKGEESMFEEFFQYAGPKSIYPGVPRYGEAPSKEIMQALGQQKQVLLAELKQQQKLPMIRSYRENPRSRFTTFFARSCLSA